jgi:membrane protease YdiL (CAAX protease family)
MSNGSSDMTTAATKDPAPQTPQPAPPVPNRVGWGPVPAILWTLGIFFGSMFAAGVVLGIVAGLTGMNGNQITDWLNESVTGQFLYIALSYGMVVTMLATVLKHYRASFRTIGLARWPGWRDVGAALTAFLVYIPTLVGTTVLAKLLVPSIDLEQKQKIGFEAARGAPQLLLVFAALVLAVPFTEEVLTRGFLYTGLKSRLSKLWAVLGTSVLFALAHLQFGSGAPLLWTAAMDTFILSLVLLYLREKTGSLWAGIGVHMLKNGLAFLALFVFTQR